NSFVTLINKLLGVTIAYIIKFIGKRDSFQNTWVIGGSSGRVYSDNSAALYEYILCNHPEINIFWIINKDSIDISKIDKISNGKYIYRKSIKGNVYALLAKVHIVSHGKSDISSYKKMFLKKRLKYILVTVSKGLKKLKKIKK